MISIDEPSCSDRNLFRWQVLVRRFRCRDVASVSTPRKHLDWHRARDAGPTGSPPLRPIPLSPKDPLSPRSRHSSRDQLLRHYFHHRLHMWVGRAALLFARNTPTRLSVSIYPCSGYKISALHCTVGHAPTHQLPFAISVEYRTPHVTWCRPPQSTWVRTDPASACPPPSIETEDVDFLRLSVGVSSSNACTLPAAFCFTGAVVGVTVFSKVDPEHFGAFDVAFLTLCYVTGGDPWPDSLPKARGWEEEEASQPATEGMRETA